LTAALPLARGRSAEARACTVVALDTIPVRKTADAEIAFKSPGAVPNGLQATKDGLWIVDQGPGSKVHLVTYEDGRVLRSFETETVRPSGITFDGEALWIGSTFSYENVRVNATTGATLERRPTPGCTVYNQVGDPAFRRSPIAGTPMAQPRPPAAAGSEQPAGARQSPRLAQPPNTAFQGAHGQEWRDGKLWTTSTSSRSIYCINPKTWVVEKRFDTPGNRPHGLAWEGRYLWHGDTNYSAFFKFDVESGAIVERINLRNGDPIPHGLTIWNDTLWYCDDLGVVCKMKIA
jgi:sugar lactone lactonase YvrE